MERFLGSSAKRIISIMLVLCMSISLCACSKDKSEDDIRNYTYSEKQIFLNDMESSFSEFRLFSVGDEVIAYGNIILDGNSVAHVFRLNGEGEINSYYTIDLGSNRFVNVDVDDEGNLIGVRWSKGGDFDISKETIPTPTVEEEMTDESAIVEGEELAQTPEGVAETEEAGGESAIVEGEELAQTPEGMAETEEAGGESAIVEGEELAQTPEGMTETEEAAEDFAAIEGEALSEASADEVEAAESDEVAPELASNLEGEPVEGDGASEAEEKTAENGYYYQLVKINKDGEILIDKNIQDCAQIREEGLLNKEYDIGTLITDAANVYLYTQDGDIITLNHEFELVKILPSSKKDKKYDYAGNLVHSRNNKLYIKYYDSQYNNKLAEADLTTGKVGTEYSLMGEKYGLQLFKGITKDFLTVKNSVLYEFNVGDSAFTKVMDFVGSNISANYISYVAGNDATHFYAIYNSLEDSKTHLSFFTKVDPSLVSEKEIITMATLSTSSWINEAVIKFNKTHENYCIRVVNYNSLYGDDEWTVSEEALNKLNTDIISGKMPDILIQMDNLLPLQTYINKGLIEDLYTFIDSDPNFSREDFLPNVLEAFSKNGHLYYITPGINVNTILVRKALLNGRNSWDMKEALETYKESGCLSFFDKETTRDQVLDKVLTLSSSQFYNLDTAECSFNSDNFKDILRFVESFPSAIDYNKINWDNYEKRFKNGTVLANNYRITSLSNFIYNLRDYYVDEYEYIGFPTTVGNGSSIMADNLICISSKSKYKEVCWEFLSYLLSEDFQKNDKTVMNYQIPVRQDVFNESVQKMKETLYWEYTTYEGKSVKEPMTIYSETGEEMPLEPFTDKEYQQFLDFFYSVTTMNEKDTKVMSILKEECNDYFEGKSTIDDCAKRIQSRVQIYLYESQ